MGLDLGGLKGFGKELDQRGGGNTFLYQKNLIEEGTDWRIAPPGANMNGRYYIEVIKWWINGVAYTSPATFGKKDVIQMEIDSYENSKDKSIKALLADEDKIKKASEFWIPGWQLKPLNDKYTDFKVVDDKCKVLDVTTMLMKDINNLVTGRAASKIDSEDGITDYELGFNLLLSKTGSGMKTKYKAEMGEQFVIPEKYRNTKEYPVIDVIKLAQDGIKSDKMLLSVINNYLFGDAIEEDPKKEKDDEEAPKAERKSAAQDDAPTGRNRAAASNEDEPAPRTGRGAAASETKDEAKPTGGGRRSLLNDLDD